MTTMWSKQRINRVMAHIKCTPAKLEHHSLCRYKLWVKREAIWERYWLGSTVYFTSIVIGQQVHFVLYSLDLYIVIQLLCQNVTQGQFLSWFELSFSSPRLVSFPALKNGSLLYHSEGGTKNQLTLSFVER